MYISDKTGLIISHDFNIILTLTDNILFFENKNKIILSNHDVLIKSSKKYKELYLTYKEKLLKN